MLTARKDYDSESTYAIWHEDWQGLDEVAHDALQLLVHHRVMISFTPRMP